MTTLEIRSHSNGQLIPFQCPEDVVKGSTEVFKALYYAPVKLPRNPVILDIGANVGAYSVWAHEAYPDSTIWAYEPSLDNFTYLKKNTEHIPGIHLERCAVLGDKWTGEDVLLRNHKNNCGEKSVYDIGEQQEEGERVRFINASQLPDAHIIKVDTEGCEFEILSGLYAPLNDIRLVALEYHRKRDRYQIGAMLYAWGLECVRDTLQVDIGDIYRGVQIFIRP